MPPIYLKSFPVAGLAYYDGEKVFSKMKTGSRVSLKLEENNPYDDHAVELFFEKHKIGYIPRYENEEIAVLLRAGYDVFEAVIQELKPDELPAYRVFVAVYVVNRPARKFGFLGKWFAFLSAKKEAKKEKPEKSLTAQQAEDLKRYIRIIWDWQSDRLPDEIFSVFSNLETLDQTKNRDLWDGLRKVIRENKEFNWKPFQQFIKPFRKRAREGYWWWDAI